MSKLLKRFLFVIPTLLAGLLVYSAVPRDAAHGIQLGGTLYAWQSFLDNFQYRRWMTATLHGDASSLESLVTIDCGGGDGCYDHGAVLVQLLAQVGDEKFSSMAGALKKETRYALRELLAAGFEYGSSVPVTDSKVRYPLTTMVLAGLKSAGGGANSHRVGTNAEI
jgi:hypothetical protein